MSLFIKKKSEWSYETSSGVELSISLAAAVGLGRGSIVLTHPTIGRYAFEYVFAGAGVGIGVKNRLLSLGGVSYSKEDFKSAGQVYILNRFAGDELSPNDFQGYTLIFEYSLIAGVGVSGYAMLLGIDPQKLITSMPVNAAKKILTMDMPDLHDPLSIGGSVLEIGKEELETFLNSGNAVLNMGGFGAGISVGASLMGNIGGLWLPFYNPELVDHTTVTEIPSNPRTNYMPVPISLSDDVLFDYNSHIIKPAGIQELNKAAIVIRLYKDRQISVTGNTDSTGSSGYNMTLSKLRAEAVKQWLVLNLPINASKVTAYGNGEKFPRSSNNTPGGRQTNRRVEILIKDY